MLIAVNEKSAGKIDWFKESLFSEFIGYEINYRFYDDGDFGSLYQIEFNSELLGGSIDFWGLDWLGIYVWDYKKEKQLFNILIEPNQNDEKEEALKKLIGFIK